MIAAVLCGGERERARAREKDRDTYKEVDSQCV
jgi:hypothetical protein